MPLHIDYRPKDLDELVGNSSIKNSLKSVLSREDKPHAFLLLGQSGCGKTTIGRIIGTMIGCSEEDFREYNSSNTRGIDTIREISQNAHYAPLVSKVKVYLLDEVHQLTRDAMNAILKILEDCPPHVYFILCTTEPEKLLKTIHTRCSAYQVKALSSSEMKKLIEWVLKGEGITKSTKLIDSIVEAAEGCPRQALVILDQIIDIPDEKKAIEAISSVKTEEAEIIDLCRSLISNKSWNDIREKVKIVIQNTEPEKIRYAILGYMNSVLLNSKTNDRASELIDLFGENTYSSGKAGITNMFYLASAKFHQ